MAICMQCSATTHSMKKRKMENKYGKRMMMMEEEKEKEE